MSGKTKWRPLGCPRRRWEDNAKMDLEETGCKTRNNYLVHDKGQW
jgi:hypothetical protein